MASESRVMALCGSDAVSEPFFDSHLVAIWLQQDLVITRQSIEAALQTLDWEGTALDSSP